MAISGDTECDCFGLECGCCGTADMTKGDIDVISSHGCANKSIL